MLLRAHVITGTLRLIPRDLRRLQPPAAEKTAVCFGSEAGGRDKSNMEKSDQEPKKEEKGVMHSFGEAYTTRSNEEGFGGTYGGNEDLVTGMHSEYDDESRGSDVTEVEKGQNVKPQVAETPSV